MDQRVRYKLSDKAFNRRATMLSRLDDASEQRREIGIVAAALESATNQQCWALVERLTMVLLKLRESQQKARKDAEELVDIGKFRHAVLNPLLDAIVDRIKEALPDDYENVIDMIESDLKTIHPRLQPRSLMEDQR